MNSGIFCEQTGNTEVYNSILIDEYYKCIFGDMKAKKTDSVSSHVKVQQTSDVPTNEKIQINVDLPSYKEIEKKVDILTHEKIQMENDRPTDENVREKNTIEIYEKLHKSPLVIDKKIITPKEHNWKEGMNARAPSYYEGDEGQYYEARIKKIFDKKYAVITFFGYENTEDVVKTEDLKESKGDTAIRRQIENALRDYSDTDDEDDDMPEWKPGMDCRAYYKPNHVIYEATINAINLDKETATVTLYGYDITYEVECAFLYKSDPALRVKQKKMAAEYMAQKAKRNPNNVQTHPHLNAAANTFEPISIPRPKYIPDGPNRADSRASQFTNDFRFDPHGPSAPPIQPRDNRESIACLVSSNYLCGYYTGYYDCKKKYDEEIRRKH